jgi:hypothetical protein
LDQNGQRRARTIARPTKIGARHVVTPCAQPASRNVKPNSIRVFMPRSFLSPGSGRAPTPALQTHTSY